MDSRYVGLRELAQACHSITKDCDYRVLLSGLSASECRLCDCSDSALLSHSEICTKLIPCSTLRI